MFDNFPIICNKMHGGTICVPVSNSFCAQRGDGLRIDDPFQVTRVFNYLSTIIDDLFQVVEGVSSYKQR